MPEIKVVFTEESCISDDYLAKIAAASNVASQNVSTKEEFERIISSNDDKEMVVVIRESLENNKTEKEIDDRLQRILITLGIPSHIKGSKFLKDAVKTAMKYPESINNITKVLYPKIAERNDTSASKVERAIRHAIDVSWNRGKIENINSLFGLKVFSKGEKPTNGELIALIADRLIIEFSA